MATAPATPAPRWSTSPPARPVHGANGVSRSPRIPNLAGSRAIISSPSSSLQERHPQERSDGGGCGPAQRRGDDALAHYWSGQAAGGGAHARGRFGPRNPLAHEFSGGISERLHLVSDGQQQRRDRRTLCECGRHRRGARRPAAARRLRWCVVVNRPAAGRRRPAMPRWRRAPAGPRRSRPCCATAIGISPCSMPSACATIG